MSNRARTFATAALLALAIAWGVALLILANVVSAYSGESVEVTSGPAGAASEVVRHSSQTLVEENGRGVLLIVALPLLAALVVALSLWRRWLVIAWSATGALGVVTVLGMLTIGIAFVPALLAVAVACALNTGLGSADRVDPHVNDVDPVRR